MVSLWYGSDWKWCIVVLGLLATLGSLPAVEEANADLPLISIEPVFIDLQLELPVDLQFAPADMGVAYVLEQKRARIQVFAPEAEQLDQAEFLDLSDQVGGRHSEEGLLTMVLDPDFADNGHFYVYYTATRPRRGVLSRFTLLENNPRQADPQSELIILEVEQPWGNHNGAGLVFAADGYLYVGLGDGGAAGDPHDHGQTPATLLGSLLRLDVNAASSKEPYRIPADNPFVDDETARDETWAYGLRNPWRFSFDSQTGYCWLADVGQNKREEVNVIVKGGNYGWRVMEGTHNFRGQPNERMIPPVFEYAHNDAHGGKSITGGFVYRGQQIAELSGAYICGDYVSGRMWAVRREGRQTRSRVIAQGVGQIASFAEDAQRELYVVNHRGGILKLQPR